MPSVVRALAVSTISLVMRLVAQDCKLIAIAGPHGLELAAS
jgi:hypothetical protein